MEKLTRQARLYAEARASGKYKTLRDCAIAAGCPEKTASQAASRYEKNAAILAHWERLGFDHEVKPSLAVPSPLAKPTKFITPIKPVEKAELAKEAAAQDVVEESKARQAQVKDIIKKKDFGQEALDYLLEVVLDDAEDPRLKVDSAKFLAKHKLDMEKHKPKGKEKPASRFITAKPPTLKAVK